MDITERKRAEEELRETGERLRDFLDNANDLIQSVAPDGRLVYVNRKWRETLGYTEEEIAGLSLFDIIHPDSLAHCTEVFQRVIAGERVDRVEAKFVTKDGRAIMVEGSTNCLFEDGKPVSTRGIFRDITERKRAEEELREERDRAQKYLDVAAVMLVAIDADGKVTLINKKGCEVLGCEEKEIIGKNWFDTFLPERIRDEVKAVAAKLLAGEIEPVEYYENPVLTKSGEERIIAWRNTVLTDEAGNIIGHLSSGGDITERKRAEEALRASEEKYRDLVEGINDGYVLLQEGKVVFVNEKMAQMGGYTVEEVVGLPFITFLSAEQRQPMVELYQAVMGGRQPVPEMLELTVLRKDGSTFPAEFRPSRVTEYKSGSAIIGIIRDITQRKWAEEVLRESEKRFRDIAENALEWIWEVDANGKYTYASPIVEEILGYEPEEILGKHFYDFFHPEEREELKRAAFQVFAQKQSFREFINRNVHKSGRTVWLWTSGVPLLDDTGNLLGYRGADTDITERKQAEEELRASEKRFRDIAENALEWIWEVDANGKYTYASPIVEEILGYEPEEILGKHFYDFFHPEEREELKRAAFQVFAQKQSFREFINRNVHKSGRTVWLWTSGVPLLDDTGNLLGYRGADTDITERKQADEALRQSEYKYRTAIDTAPDGLMILDLDYSIVDSNRTNTRALGYTSREEVIGRSVLECVTPDTRGKIREGLEQALSKGYIANIEVVGLSRDGREIPVEVNISLLTGDEGQPAGFVIVARDIGHRKRAEEALRESEARHRALFEASADGILTADAETRKFEHANPALCKMLGYSEEELKEMGVPDIHPKDSLEHVISEFDAIAREEKTLAEDIPYLRKDGTIVYVDIAAATTLIGGRKRSVAFFRDITERKRWEEALRQSEHKYRTAIDTARDGFMILDLDYSIVDSNRTNTRALGYTSREEVIGRSVLEFATPDTRRKTRAGLERALSKGYIANLEIVALANDSREIPVEINISLLTGDEGQPAGFVMVVRDIRRRNEAQEALSQAAAHWQDTFDAVEDLVAIVDKDFRVVRANQATNTAFAGAKVLGAHCYELFHGTEAPPPNCPSCQTFRSGEATHAELCEQHLGGRWFDVYAYPIKGEDGTVEQVVHVVRDITERKQADEALRQSEYKYRTAIDTAPDGLMILDLDYSIVDSNRTNTRALGYTSREEVIGRSVLECVTPDTRRKIREGLEQALSKGYIANLEVVALSRNGREIPVEVNVSLLRGEEGQPAGFVIVGRDIGQRKRAEEEIRRYTQSLEALYAVALVASQSLDMENMLDTVLEKVLEVVGVDAGFIHFSDAEANEVILKAHKGVSEEFVAVAATLEVGEEEFQRWQQDRRLAFGLHRILGEPALGKVKVVSEKEGLQSYVAVPLWSKDVYRGAMVLACRSPRRYSDEELELLNAISNEIAVAIENAKLFAEASRTATIDALTGLHNHRYFQERLEEEAARLLRFGGECSLIMLDLDHFKIYNDLFGHVAGDEVLKRIGQVLREYTRQVDIACRYGGEEFAVILPQTGSSDAYQAAERLRRAAETALALEGGIASTPLTISLGVASAPSDGLSREGLIRHADRALREAKERGRNQTCLASELAGAAPAADEVSWEVAELLEAASLNTVYALAAAVDARDHYTYGHSRNVSKYAVCMGKALGLSRRKLARLRIAGLLHDIGKIGLSDTIIRKPGPLDEAEWETMRKHSELGATIISHTLELANCVPAIHHHHERYDGGGYPDGLRGEDIPLEARIIALADAYDTMTTPRAYRETVSPKDALEELRRCANTQFDPDLVETFAAMVDVGMASTP